MTKLEQRLVNQIAALNLELHKQSISFEDQEAILKNLKAQLHQKDALIAELELNLADAREQLEQPELPYGDSMPGHEGEANGTAH